MDAHNFLLKCWWYLLARDARTSQWKTSVCQARVISASTTRCLPNGRWNGITLSINQFRIMRLLSYYLVIRMKFSFLFHIFSFLLNHIMYILPMFVLSKLDCLFYAGNLKKSRLRFLLAWKNFEIFHFSYCCYISYYIFVRNCDYSDLYYLHFFHIYY